MNIDLYTKILQNHEDFIKPIPKNNTVKNFIFDKNQSLKKEDIPNIITHLTFGWYFNQPLKKEDIPNSVAHLTFGQNFNQPLNNENIPKNIISILLYENYNKNLINTNKNILIGFLNHDKNNIIYNNFLEIKRSNINLMHTYIENNLTKDKFIGNIILKDLIKKVLHPKRLQNISEIYNVLVQQLLENY